MQHEARELELVLRQDQVDRFATATGDVNPLHVSAAFARRTPYGRPIAHGALVALVALTMSGLPPVRVPESLTVQFRRPVFPGRRYVVGLVEPRAAGWTIAVTDAGVPALTLRAGRPPAAATRVAATVGATDEAASTWVGEYALADPGDLRLLLRDFGDAAPERFVLPLSWASWFTGMVSPGRDALLSQIVADGLGQSDGRMTWTARLVRDDPRFGSVATRAETSDGAQNGVVHVEAFRRPPAPMPRRTSSLPEGAALAGKEVLVVGGSRGIGAAMTGAFAGQAATVHVAHAHSTAHVRSLQEEFGTDRVRALRMDATDVESVSDAVRQLTQHGVRLDGVVLCAAPPLQSLPVHADTALEALDHIHRALRMAWLPMAHALPLLRTPSGWVVVLSSAAVDEPPPQWTHYIAAKAALEGFAASLARDSGLAVLVARPPRVWTDLTNGPGAGQGALSPTDVAVQVLQWVLAGPVATGRSETLEPGAFGTHPGPSPSP